MELLLDGNTFEEGGWEEVAHHMGLQYSRETKHWLRNQ